MTRTSERASVEDTSAALSSACCIASRARMARTAGTVGIKYTSTSLVSSSTYVLLFCTILFMSSTVNGTCRARMSGRDRHAAKIKHTQQAAK